GYSVTGGFVYRGPGNSRMQGMYFYGDFGSGRLWGLKHDGTNWQNRQLVQTSYNFSTFGEYEAGQLYAAQYTYFPNIYFPGILRIDDTGLALSPEFGPANGILSSPGLVTLTSPTPGATIRLTLDGRDPTEADPGVASGGGVMVTSNVTLKA